MHIINIGILHYYIFTKKKKIFLQSYMSLYLKIPHHQILIANSYLILLNYFNLVSKNWKTLISVWHFLLNKYLLFHFLYSILYSTHFCILLYVLLFIVYLVSHFFCYICNVDNTRQWHTSYQGSLLIIVLVFSCWFAFILSGSIQWCERVPASITCQMDGELDC